MIIRNIKIGTQLKLSLGALLFFVIVLGVISYEMNLQLFEQTATMYDHPLKVRSAIGNLESDILKMRLETRNLLLAKTNLDKQNAIETMELSAADALKQFDILHSQYLGSRTDIDNALKAYIRWKSANEEDIKLALSGEIVKATESFSLRGKAGIYMDELSSLIGRIDSFAKNKADELFSTAAETKESLNMLLLLLVALILFLSFIINFQLLRNIRKPIYALTSAAQKFQSGEMNARSNYDLNNEFGVLSDSFNNLAASIQKNIELNKKTANISELMLSEDDARKFFNTILNAISIHTGSYLAAAYLLSEDKKQFEHFESIGVNENARQSFSAQSLEGEFGPVIASRKILHIKNISKDTRFVFNTVSGKFTPCEIITIPIISGNEIISIISMAGISKYGKETIQLIENIIVPLSARIEGILAYRKIKEFSGKLELQNRELEAQKTELASQSSELMEQNTELEMQKKQLDESSRLKTTFLSNMSHELRTPLNSVIALSGVLNRRLADKVPEEEYSYLEVIERNGKHLLSLINDILDISRIEAGKEEVEFETFNFNKLIDETIYMIQPQANQKNLKLYFADDKTDLSLTSDITKCRHILQNLIGNAVKFTEEGSVTIAAKKINDNMIVTVSDTGIGISEENLPNIFDEFRQADGSTSRRFGGTGLGLAIAKKYAKLIGGSISVKSKIDEGSEFTLALPLNYTAVDKGNITETIIDFIYQKKGSISKNTESINPKTILLVDDSEPAIIQIKDIMEEEGYNILAARNGEEALTIIKQTIPDAIILDLMMPVVDGFGVLKTIREADETLHIPVLILTAKNITKDELKFLKRNNVHQLIQKGDVKREELLNAISAMVYKQTEETIKAERELQIIEGKPVVLVVEDNPDNMITVKALLSGNYTVIEATEGNESIEFATKYMPNLILMDIGLPGMDGIKAFKAIRNIQGLKNIPVIALTASAMTNDREAILSYGFDGYIPKPIDQIVFFKTINEILYGK